MLSGIVSLPHRLLSPGNQPGRGSVDLLSQGIHRCYCHPDQLSRFGAASLSETDSQVGRLKCLSLYAAVVKQRSLKQPYARGLIRVMCNLKNLTCLKYRAVKWW